MSLSKEKPLLFQNMLLLSQAQWQAGIPCCGPMFCLVLVWPRQILSKVWFSFTMGLQLNLLDLNRFYGSDISEIKARSNTSLFGWCALPDGFFKACLMRLGMVLLAFNCLSAIVAAATFVGFSSFTTCVPKSNQYGWLNYTNDMVLMSYTNSCPLTTENW